MKAIEVKGVTKIYNVPVKPKSGFFNRLVSVFHRTWIKKIIIKDISFDIEQGEFVGYIGPNGAGKSTTIKLLTGILTPSSGTISVLGFSPTEQRYEYTYNIGVVFGHRSVLEFDIPVIDSFKLFKSIYELDESTFDSRLRLFSKMLALDDLLHIPVRKLSLGQRMRCEIAACLLHRPKVIFLDEPTIGLDAISKSEIRSFLTKINKEENVTIILTTHDMDDIEELCHRIILIDDGSLVYDGSLNDFKKEFIAHKTVEYKLLKVLKNSEYKKILSSAHEVEHEGDIVRLRVDSKKDITKILKSVLECAVVEDISIHTPRLEHLIKEVYLKNKKKVNKKVKKK